MNEQERTKEREHERVQRDGELSQMQAMAQRNEEQRTSPLPQAEPPAVTPFPPLVVGGLWIGILAGALLGLIWGILLRTQTIVVPGWEGLFSMAPFAFEFFWLIAGVALGVVLAGIVTLIVLPPPSAREKER